MGSSQKAYNMWTYMIISYMIISSGIQNTEEYNMWTYMIISYMIISSGIQNTEEYIDELILRFMTD